MQLGATSLVAVAASTRGAGLYGVPYSCGVVQLGRRWLLFLALCCCLVILSQSVPLPAPTPADYAVVSAGFGNLNFSFHYSEYGSSALGLNRFDGRYFTNDTMEWTDSSDGYYLQMVEGECDQYSLSAVQLTRMVGSASGFVVDLITEAVQFTNLGDTQLIRSQPSVHFGTHLTYSSSSVASASVEAFLQQAYATAGVSDSSPYSVSIDIDVYYSGSSSSLQVIGDGNVPLRFTINGTRTDSHGTRQLNIVYDFMMWVQLTSLDVQTQLYAYTCNAASQAVPAIPSTTALGLQNASFPLASWSSGRATLELTSSSLLQPMQMDTLLEPLQASEIHVFVNDPSAFLTGFSSYLYKYDQTYGFNFSSGGRYTINEDVTVLDFAGGNTKLECTGTDISPNTASPLQWLNGNSLLTILANPQFTSGVQYVGRDSIRGITADVWSLSTTSAYNGTQYTFTVKFYATASGWSNMGRINMTPARQLLRLAYTGVSSPISGNAPPMPYTLQMDFFIQHQITWDGNSPRFALGSYCKNYITLRTRLRHFS